jgi:hypothetical protein
MSIALLAFFPFCRDQPQQLLRSQLQQFHDALLSNQLTYREAVTWCSMIRLAFWSCGLAFHLSLSLSPDHVLFVDSTMFGNYNQLLSPMWLLNLVFMVASIVLHSVQYFANNGHIGLFLLAVLYFMALRQILFSFTFFPFFLLTDPLSLIAFTVTFLTDMAKGFFLFFSRFFGLRNLSLLD